MDSPLLDHPAPDFAELVRVLTGEQEPKRVHLAELFLDEEILQSIAEEYLETSWVPLTEETGQAHYAQVASIYYRLGYDYVPVHQWVPEWINHPDVGWNQGTDTAILSRGERTWANEGYGLIRSWDDLEKYPWDEIRPDYTRYEFTARSLPEGMKMVVMTDWFEHLLETLLGYEGLFYMLHDGPALVAEITDRWGRMVHELYQNLAGMDAVGAIFHPDDLGFRTSTFLSPADLRKYVFPWLKKFAGLAHDRGKTFWFHSCGNHYKADTIEDLIDDVGIDAFHSFEDTILPVVDFKARYGDRVAVLGGVDMDKLIRMDEAPLRAYIRDILDRCMVGGRYALGTGNSVANYVPLDRYFMILQEGRRWAGIA